jgi:cytolysin (calcineurin-like family phosphatase)
MTLSSRWSLYDHLYVQDADQPEMHIPVYECRECGALVVDAPRHDEFHNRQETR